MLLLTVAVVTVYIGSAIYTSSIPSIRTTFGVSETTANLGLTLYILAYGIGPMFLVPLQEMPSIGRNPIYVGTLALFLILQIPIVTAKNMSTVLAMRFLSGFVGSPALATGVCRMIVARRVELMIVACTRAHLWAISSRLVTSLMLSVYGLLEQVSYTTHPLLIFPDRLFVLK
jgi:predicted MFS family arabinose efflux permease